MISNTIFKSRKKIFKFYWPIAIAILTIIFILAMTALFINLQPILWGLNIAALIAIFIAVAFVVISIILFFLYSVGGDRSIKDGEMSQKDIQKEFGIEDIKKEKK